MAMPKAENTYGPGLLVELVNDAVNSLENPDFPQAGHGRFANELPEAAILESV